MTPRLAFGDELRRARERRGLSLADIAGDTKIARSLLEALERGDCSRWPGGLYNRAYVRDYARAVGLRPDDTVARFVACFGDAARPGATPTQSGTPPPPLRLSLESDPADARAALLLRARLVVADAIVVAGSAAALAATAGIDGWLAVAAASLGVHALGVLRTGNSASGAVADWVRRAGFVRERRAEVDDDAVAAGSASMQLS